VNSEADSRRTGSRAVVRSAARRLGAGAAAPVLLGLAVLAWCSVFGVLVVLRHHRFASFDLDAGIFDQAIWLLARGDSFITVRGLDVFAQHASVAYYLLVPLSWLGAGQDVLNVLQVISIGAAAVAVFGIARFHLGSDWPALALAVSLLLHPSAQWFAQELFHPDVMAIAPLLFAWLAALHGRWRWFAALLVLAMAWKEDVALAGAAVGVLLAIRGERRAGALTAAGALLWFMLATLLVQHEGHGVFYARVFYGDFGSSSFEVATNVLLHPGRVVEHLGDADARGYVGEMLQPFGFAALLSPLTLIIGLPQAFFNLISVQSFTWRTELHYAALPLVAATIATVEGVARLRRPWLRHMVVGLVVVAACAATATSGAAPVSRHFHEGMWPLAPERRQVALEAAVRAPPREAVVSASYRLVPHMTHRRGIYSFPNPWIPTNYGQPSAPGPSPEVVRWLVVDRLSLGARDRALLDRLLTSDFRVVSARQGIVVAARRRP
jgi:uncharacterized membrane protein